MTTEKSLHERSESQCELCGSFDNLSIYKVPPNSQGNPDDCILTCNICLDQIEHPEKMDPHHWRCLNESMWNQEPAVQVMTWRMLKQLSHERWAQDLLDILYLEDDVKKWAQATNEQLDTKNNIKHVDSNGAIINAGDTVTLIKDLNVKGASFTAKRGTTVRNISLVHDNPEHIEGRINGQQIVILTKFVKRTN